jgi:tetratricopeptide (TPR) repeat protein
MKSQCNEIGKLALVLTAALLTTGLAFGQGTQQPQPKPPAPTQQTPGDKPNAPQVTPLTLDSAPPPVSAEEEAAYKAFHDDQSKDVAKKDQMAEDFLQKYPESRYRAEMYNWQVKSYFSKGQVDKMEAAADKELALVPNDWQVLAIIGSTLPRVMNANTPEPQKRLAKAEQYCQKALELLPTATKPEGVTDELFQKEKNMSAAFAHSGLGLVAFRRGKFADAIPDFEQSVKLDPQPDPVNYYLLGLSDEKASHFDDAVAAFTKCAAIPSGMQATCTQNIEEAKKLAATQMSAPK